MLSIWKPRRPGNRDACYWLEVWYSAANYAKLAEQLKLFSLPDSHHNVGGAALCCANTAINVKLLSKDNVN